MHLTKPPWLKRRLPAGSEHEKIKDLLNKGRLNTVCQEARCPNMWECFSRKTATFMIMGSHCTRQCRFCAVGHGPLGPPDPNEPVRVAQAVARLQLRYAVITSVTRDDLPDGGATCFVQTVKEIRNRNPGTLVEVLIPDFQGNHAAVRTIVGVHPDVVNHNIETVPRLYATVRPGAVYRRSLDILKLIKIYDASIPIKSGLMLGLGERSTEIHATLEELFDSGCNLLTLGQYLQPTPQHLPVKRYVEPAEFEHWRAIALSIGFSEAAGGPFVRSSYQAESLFRKFS